MPSGASGKSAAVISQLQRNVNTCNHVAGNSSASTNPHTLSYAATSATVHRCPASRTVVCGRPCETSGRRAGASARAYSPAAAGMASSTTSINDPRSAATAHPQIPWPFIGVSGPARNTIASATSAGLPPCNRLELRRKISRSITGIDAVMSVSMKPGATPFTTMPRSATNGASARTMPITPAFDAA